MTKEIQQLLIDISGDTKAIREKLQSHIDNPVIHQVPPCRHHDALSKRIWMVAFAAVSALVGVVWNTIKP